MNNTQGSERSQEMQSENINELAEALANAQGEIEGANKISTNPSLNSKYADFHSVRLACQEPLSNNNLSVVQPTIVIGTEIFITTILIHKSGQWIKGIMWVPFDSKAPPRIGRDGKPKERNHLQDLGSAIQYIRRYAYCLMVGISQKEADDDGHKAGPMAEEPDDFIPPLPLPKNETVENILNAFASKKGTSINAIHLLRFIGLKAIEHKKTEQVIMNAAMKDDAQFEAFYAAYCKWNESQPKASM